jgi:hypothetical protein
MEEKVLFAEQQKFSQWYVWLLLIALNAMFICGIYKQVYKKETFGDHPTSDAGLFIGFAGMLLLTRLFYSFKLQTIIKNDGIYVRFFPFHIAYRKYIWDELIKTYVRKYNPIPEYGGWGLRFGIKGNALNVSGNDGLQLEIFSKRNLLIGTKKPEEIKEVLNKMGKYKAE